MESTDQSALHVGEVEYIEAKFLPILHLHSEDNYKPSLVSWYLKRVHMRFDKRGGTDPGTFLPKGSIRQNNILNQSYNGQSSGGETKSNFFLQIPNDGDEMITRNGDISQFSCYVHIVPGRNPLEIQYWFFYPYNGDVAPGPAESGHEGDWEHITVRLKENEKEIDQIYYAAHHQEGKWYVAEGNISRDGRPVVYSAKHTHASYPKPGRYDRGILPDDVTDDQGYTIDYNAQYAWLSMDAVSRNSIHNWVFFSGRWGEVGLGANTSGPYGPQFQNAWNGDPQEYVR